MDATIFIREFDRICKLYHNCDKCILGEVYCGGEGVDAEEVVSVIEQWRKEHPLMTNGQKVMDIIKDAGMPITLHPYQEQVGVVQIAVTIDWWDAEYKGE